MCVRLTHNLDAPRFLICQIYVDAFIRKQISPVTTEISVIRAGIFPNEQFKRVYWA